MTTEEKAEAYAEKAYYPAPEYGWYESDHEAMTDVLEQAYLAGATEAYAALIDRISGKGTFERNPYVFVYEFELVK